MAHYKRKKCRNNAVRSRRGSYTSWRARYGFKPVRVMPHHWELDGNEFEALWHPSGPCGNRGRKISGYYSPMNGWPAWWDRIFHTRRTRAANRRMEGKVMRGIVDPDDTVWPHPKRPHQYYW